MIALASAGATCVRVLLLCGHFIRLPLVLSCLPVLDFAGASIDAVAINRGTRFGIAAALGIVNFAENKLKISLCLFFRAIRDAIQ